MASQKVVEAAVALRRLGLNPIPDHRPSFADGKLAGCSCDNPECPKPGKHPIESNWPSRVDLSEEEVRALFGSLPECNLSVSAGKGWIIIENENTPEGEAGIKALEADYDRALPRTPTVRTGSGGFARIFRWPLGDMSVGKSPYPDVEFKASLGLKQCVPPSLHYSGNEYTWEVSPDEASFATLPIEWQEKITGLYAQRQAQREARRTPTFAREELEALASQHGVDREEALERARRYLDKTEPSVQGEDGSGPFYRAACLAVELTMHEDNARSALEHYNDTKCDPPWSESEIEHALGRALQNTALGSKLYASLSERPVSRFTLHEVPQEETPAPPAPSTRALRYEARAKTLREQAQTILATLPEGAEGKDKKTAEQKAARLITAAEDAGRKAEVCRAEDAVMQSRASAARDQDRKDSRERAEKRAKRHAELIATGLAVRGEGPGPSRPEPFTVVGDEPEYLASNTIAYVFGMQAYVRLRRPASSPPYWDVTAPVKKEAVLALLLDQGLTKGESDYLLEQRHHLFATTIDLLPNGETVYLRDGEKYLNSWTPPEDWTKPSQGTGKDGAPTLHEIVSFIAGPEDGAAEYVYNWLAWAIQNPGSRTKNVLVFLGEQGTGKSLVVNAMKAILGVKNCGDVSNSSPGNRFDTTDYAGKLLVYGSELDLSEHGSAEAWFKTLTGEAMVGFEPKNVTKIWVPNRTKMIIASNKTEVIRIQAGDDRVSILRQTEKPDREYQKRASTLYGKGDSQFSDAGKLEVAAFHRFLLEWQVDEELRSKPFDSEARRDAMQAGADSVDSWLDELRDSGELVYRERGMRMEPIPLAAEITESQAYQSYVLFCEETNRSKRSKATWLHELKRRGIRSARPRCETGPRRYLMQGGVFGLWGAALPVLGDSGAIPRPKQTPLPDRFGAPADP